MTILSWSSNYLVCKVRMIRQEKYRVISTSLTVNQRLKMGNYNPIGEEGTFLRLYLSRECRTNFNWRCSKSKLKYSNRCNHNSHSRQKAKSPMMVSQEQEADVQQQQMEGQPEETTEQPSQFQSNVIGEVLRSLGVDPDSIPKHPKASCCQLVMLVL